MMLTHFQIIGQRSRILVLVVDLTTRILSGFHLWHGILNNCILPKKGKEIQETIEEYIRSGGSLNSKSLPKRLINKRQSAKVNGNIKFHDSASNSQYPTEAGFSRFINARSSHLNNKTAIPSAKLTILNPELKNLNLKAVENIVVQRLLNYKSHYSNTNFMKYRNAKQRNRLRTAGNVTDILTGA